MLWTSSGLGLFWVEYIHWLQPIRVKKPKILTDLNNEWVTTQTFSTGFNFGL
jgi:hypothetical protein